MGVTEDTVSDLLGEYLRSKGVNVLTHFWVSFPSGWGKPDLRIENDGTFYGEAEWEGREWEGFGEASDYLKAVDATGTFVIVYPKRLKRDLEQRIGETAKPTLSMCGQVLSEYKYKVAFLWKDQPTDMATLSLDELPQWVRANITLKKTPAPDLDWTVSILRQTAENLTKELGYVKDPDLFRSILGTVKDREKAAGKAAGYLLVNQITFYRVLSDIIGLPKIEPDELSSPRDLSSYFSKALDVDYYPVFSCPIAHRFSRKSLTLLKSAIKSIFALSPERIGHEALGKVFHELIPLSFRKKIAAFYTKDKAGRILAELSIDRSDAKVMDPACGSETLLAHAYKKKSLLAKTFEEEDHRRFVEEDIIGIDIMPFAAHLSTINLSLQSPEYTTDEVRIGIEDSTSLKPGMTISPLSRILPEDKKQRTLEDYVGRPAIKSEAVERGAITLDALPGRPIQLGEVNNIIVNPPFTRQETIATFSKEYKKELETRFLDSKKKGIIDKRMSYCSYFILLADKFLKEDGRIAAVLPASILRKDTDENLRNFLLDEYVIEYIIVREDKPNFSESTDFRETLFILKKGKAPEKVKAVSYVIIRNYEDMVISHMKDVCQKVKIDEVIKDTHFEVRGVNQKDLKSRNLFHHASASDYSLMKTWGSLKSNDNLTKIESLITNLGSSIKRGIETARGGSIQALSINAADSRHLKSNDVWIVEKSHGSKVTARHRFSNDRMDIPKRILQPSLRRISGVNKIDITKQHEYVVKSSFSKLREFLSKSMPEKDIDLGFIENWENYIGCRASNLIIARRFDVSAEGTCLLSFFSGKNRVPPGVTWSIKGLSDVEAKIMTLWYNSTINVLQLLIERMPTRGAWMEFHEYIIQKLDVLDPTKLSEKEKKNLLSVFESVKDEQFPALWEQLAMNAFERRNFTNREIIEFDDIFEGFSKKLGKGFEPRRKIDHAILDCLGYSKEKRKNLLNKLYSGVLKEIGILKRMMS